ncbi:MAG: hypothetical protein ACK53Y_18380, partial [bacterium]
MNSEGLPRRQRGARLQQQGWRRVGLGLNGRGHGQPHRRGGKPSGPDVQGHRAYRRRGAAYTVPGRGRPDA